MSFNNDLTPILVGAGQCVEREYTEHSPMDLAARAATSAIEASGGSGIAEAIDTIAVVKFFADSAPMWESKLGRSNNPPQSVAKRIGASPKHRIYSETGGDQPQSLLIAPRPSRTSATPSATSSSSTGAKSSRRRWKTADSAPG